MVLVYYFIYFLFICRIEVEETTVNGSFNMIFLGHGISFAYRDHINIVAR
jgi:hypothetical protein